jgi:hypothetical protein
VPEQIAELLLALELPPTTNYTKEEQYAKDEKGIKEKRSWWKLPDQRVFVPSAIAAPLVKQQHKLTLGENSPGKTAGQIVFHSQDTPVCAQISARCITCA